jgi:hypothetical protein
VADLHFRQELAPAFLEAWRAAGQLGAAEGSRSGGPK